MIFVLAMSLLLPLSKQDPQFSHVLQELFNYQRYLCFPLFDLIVSSSITYVFYYQALMVQRELKMKEIVQVDDDDDSDNESLTNLVMGKKESGGIVNSSNADMLGISQLKMIKRSTNDNSNSHKSSI